MKKLAETKKVTLATLKAFAKRNSNNLFVKEVSSFDGMTDGIEYNDNAGFVKTEITDKTNYYQTGIQGVYTVGSSRDYFSIYEDSKFYGIEVYNCCGKSILAVKKEVKEIEFIDFEKELLN